MYTISGQWQGGFQAEVNVRNTGTTAINGWSLRWSFPNGQQITQIWGASHTQSGAAVTASNVSWNAQIPPGGSTSFGFLANWTGSNNEPTAFTLNGSTCSVA